MSFYLRVYFLEILVILPRDFTCHQDSIHKVSASPSGVWSDFLVYRCLQYICVVVKNDQNTYKQQHFTKKIGANHSQTFHHHHAEKPLPCRTQPKALQVVHQTITRDIHQVNQPQWLESSRVTTRMNPRERVS